MALSTTYTKAQGLPFFGSLGIEIREMKIGAGYSLDNRHVRIPLAVKQRKLTGVRILTNSIAKSISTSCADLSIDKDQVFPMHCSHIMRSHSNKRPVSLRRALVTMLRQVS